MKLTIFNNATMPKGWGGIKTTVAKVHFGKTGVTTFNKPASDLMEIKPDDKVSFAMDAENPGDWYFFKDPKNGFPLRGKEFEKTGMVTFNHSGLTKRFFESLQLDANQSHGFLIAGVPTILEDDKSKTKYWGVLVVAKV